MKRVAPTQQTVRCPLEGCPASLIVSTRADGNPSRRHVDVTACSLQPSTSFITPARTGYFSDVPPPVGYVCEVDPILRHSRITCAKPCLAVLNAAEAGGEPVRCTSGVSDAMELARQTQSPAIARVVWFHSV
jgi:hypothetical protein